MFDAQRVGFPPEQLRRVRPRGRGHVWIRYSGAWRRGTINTSVQLYPDGPWVHWCQHSDPANPHHGANAWYLHDRITIAPRSATRTPDSASTWRRSSRRTWRHEAARLSGWPSADG